MIKYGLSYDDIDKTSQLNASCYIWSSLIIMSEPVITHTRKRGTIAMPITRKQEHKD